MIESIQRFFIPPTLRPVEGAQTARQLFFVLISGIPITLVVAVQPRLLGEPFNPTDLLPLLLAALLFLLLLLLRRGYARTTAAIMISLSALAVFTASTLNGGVRDPAILIVPLLLTLSSVLLDQRATTVLGALAVTHVSLLYASERFGVHFQQVDHLDSSYLSIVLITIVMTTIMLYFTVNEIVNYARRTQMQATELQDKNVQLVQIKSILEARSSDLSALNLNLQQEISERARAEAALRQKQKLESIGLLAGGVAHDFNNLLLGIQGYSELLTLQLESSHPARQNLDKITHFTQRAADLTRQLLAYAGKGSFQITLVNLNQLIQENCTLFNTILSKASTLTLDLDDKLPAIEADQGQLQQVVMNLIINAAEALGERAGQIAVSTRHLCFDQAPAFDGLIGHSLTSGHYIALRVEDNGDGMEQATIEKIFDPFFTTKVHGHGLGLSAVLGIVKALGGALRLESQVSIGSAFTLYLPVNGEQIASLPALTPPAAPNVPSAALLLVDDTDDVREAVADMLDYLGYQVFTAPDGESALSLYRAERNKIGVVLLDMMMPGLSGLETLQKLRAIDADVKVVLCSGYSEDEIKLKSPLEKPTGFLNKPYSFTELRQTIDKVLN